MTPVRGGEHRRRAGRASAAPSARADRDHVLDGPAAPVSALALPLLISTARTPVGGQPGLGVLHRRGLGPVDGEAAGGRRRARR